MLSQLQHTAVTYQKLVKSRPIKRATVKFVPDETFLPQFGWLTSTAEPAPCKCEVVDLPVQVFSKEVTKFVVIVKDDDGNRCYSGNTHLVNAKLDDQLLQVSNNKNGSYQVSFIAEKIGEAKLSVTANETQIKGSPFKIIVKTPYTTIDKPLKIIKNYGDLGRPYDISFSRDGTWAVTHCSTSFIHIYDKKDEQVKMFGCPGVKNDQLECPSGVAFDEKNNLYVVDSGNSRIQKYDLRGSCLFQFGQEKLKNVRGITVHSGRVYVADKANRSVLVFDTDGQYCSSIGSQYLRTPCDVTVDINNQLHVTDSNCVHTFTLDGDYVGKFGLSTGRGQLNKPWGIATDLRGNLFVTDISKHHVAVFDKDRTCVHCFGSKGQADGEFNTPLGIALSPMGHIYICDFENKRIQVF